MALLANLLDRVEGELYLLKFLFRVKELLPVPRGPIEHMRAFKSFFIEFRGPLRHSLIILIADAIRLDRHLI